jgi:hypothetical protein
MGLFFPVAGLFCYVPRLFRILAKSKYGKTKDGINERSSCLNWQNYLVIVILVVRFHLPLAFKGENLNATLLPLPAYLVLSYIFDGM